MSVAEFRYPCSPDRCGSPGCAGEPPICTGPLAKVIPLVSCPPPSPPAPPTTTQRPSVGRDVHYVSRGSADGVFPPECRTAKVTEVDDLGVLRRFGDDGAGPRVGLCVTNPNGHFFHPLAHGGGVAYDSGVIFDPDAIPDGNRVAPCCTGLAHTPGSWHWPARTS